MTAGGLVARRQVLRRLREYVMVVLLIALPVAGASGAAVLVASAMPTTRQEITSTLGQTAARVHWTGYETRQSVRGLNQWSGDEVTYRAPADVVPGVERTLTLRTLWTRVGTSPAGVVIGPVTDPAFEGRYVLERGRAAERGDEVLVTPALARDDGLGTGSTTTVHRVPGADGPRDLEVTVVGIMSEVGGGTDDRQVFARDDLAAGLPDPSSTASASSTSSEQYLVGDAVDWDEVRELGRAGFVVWSAAVVADPPPEGTPGLESEAGYGSTGTYAALGVVFAVFAGAEVALLAGAAFGVGARRQRRTLAVLAAVGADQRTLTRIVTRQGVWVGVVAAVTGLAVGVDLGIGVVALARRAGVDVGPFAFWGVHVPGVVVAGIGLFAVAVSWIAAVAPARRAARVDVMDSLRGGTASGAVDAASDRGRGRRSAVLAGVLVVGGVLACFGAGWVSYATSVPVGSRWWWAAFVGLAVSAVAALVGVLLLVPVLVRRLGRASTLAPVPLRLALRDASHGVARTAPAVAAVTTAVFVAVFGVSMSTAAARQSEDSFYRPYPAGTVAISYDQASDLRVPGGSPEAASLDSAAVAAVARDLPVGDRAVWQTPVPSGYDSNGAPVAVDAVTPWAVLTVPDRCDSSTGRLEGLSSREAQRITDADPACDYPLGSFTSQDNIIVTDEDGLAVTLGAAPSTAARAAFESGGVIAFDPSLVVEGEATIGLATPAEVEDGFDASATPSTSVSLPAVVQRPTTLSTGAVLMSPGTAERLGFELTQRAVVMVTDRQPTEDEAAGLRAAVTTATDGRATVETSPVDRGLDLALVLALLATTLVCAAAAAVALGLARAEGLSDQVTMQAVGGTDAQRRAMSFWQGVVVVGTGAVLGTILGLVPTGAMVWASDLPFAPPWWVLAVVAVGLPLVVAAGSALTSRRPASLVRRPVLD